MSQTSYTAAFILLGFIIFITVRGELPAYKDAILGTSTAAQAPSTLSQAASSIASGLTLPTLSMIPTL